MNLDEILKLKSALEQIIQNELNEFCAKTGVKRISLDIIVASEIGGKETYIVQIEAKI